MTFPKDVNSYIENISDERKDLLKTLSKLIIENHPEVEVVMSYKIPTFNSGSGWVALGYRKDGVSMYTNGPENIEKFKLKNPHIKSGKGSLKFKVNDVLPIYDLKEVLMRALT